MVPGTGETFTILAGKGVICMTLFVGIDVSAKDFKVRVLNSTGEEPAKRFKAENNLPGSQSLIAYLLPICRQHHVSRLVFGLESTSIYSWHLQMFLAEQDSGGVCTSGLCVQS